MNYHLYDAAAFLEVKSEAPHQLVVAGSNTVPVHRSDHAFPADLLNTRDSAAVNLFSMRTLQTFADRVRGRALHRDL